jgi:hypothetical protein
MNLKAIKALGKNFCNTLVIPLELLTEPIASNLLEKFIGLRVGLQIGSIL